MSGGIARARDGVSVLLKVKHPHSRHSREGVHERSYYIELESSGLRWDVFPKPAHMKLLGKRVCATGHRPGYKLLNLSEMTLAE
jgi:hypothetical protein